MTSKTKKTVHIDRSRFKKKFKKHVPFFLVSEDGLFKNKLTAVFLKVLYALKILFAKILLIEWVKIGKK